MIPSDEKPIPESFWVVPGRFLAGGYPSSWVDDSQNRRHLAAFLAAGINVFIDLTCVDECSSYLTLLQEMARSNGISISHQRFSFPDFDVPSHEEMVAALDAIDAALAADGNVYLHCLGGIGRTGTTLGCWLIRHGMKPAEALAHLRHLYMTSAQSLFSPFVPETGEQVEFILNWVEHGLA
jgi:protein-tyrosine phosphatase